MSKQYLAIDIGCHECGIDSEVIGVFKTRKGAENACEKRSVETDNWREGGQSVPQVFEIEVK